MADLAAASAGMAIDMNGARAGPGPEIAESKDAGQEIGEIEGKGAPAVERKDPGDDQCNEKKDET